MKLTFMGATGTVTGSKYLLELNDKKILIDCGLFQGIKELRLRNWSPFPVAPKSIDAVVLTHAHIDHSGYIPLLVKQGFKGKIYATKATKELCSILLPDSGFLQEEDARRANKYGYSKHHPAEPLYTQEDANQSLKHFAEVEYDTPYSMPGGAEISWYRAGHILGSAFVAVEHNQKKVLFSGDIGRLNDPIMRPSELIKSADYLILESTYGDRLHDKTDPLQVIADIVNTTYNRGGTVLIPAFAVGRSQTILYYIYLLKKNKLIPDIPLYLDSPMAIDATELLLKNSNEHKLSPELCRAVCHVARYVQTSDESMAIDRDKQPKIIISASGMMTGGRVLHHLKALVTNPLNTILMTGFQASGTRGDRMLRHEPTVKIHGDEYPVKAQLELLTNASAHADYQEILYWLSHFNQAPKKVFITHGEPTASQALKEQIEKRFKWACELPTYLQKAELN
ncbi:MBL fold metallo-hydrolase RNA specificity domain-containing protein [Legionella worsleiensis]|uniref:Metallo-beta-lactamase superfamily protein n=1 Tax=Legionella worsleiensis TaxID=45076 RepID=A0A0W1AKR9_9GAMM|nr:MBL fold metallo-hydrolase [Legionella worsleiensis]KTD81951.1 metallo-beta-lactamase superfamily protein [Legionella worsleiensis]STY31314.1 metallo-beta-lactamase superfamily protein [Legionella worsleiensis]